MNLGGTLNFDEPAAALLGLSNVIFACEALSLFWIATLPRAHHSHARFPV